MFPTAGQSGDFASGSCGSHGVFAPSPSAITINALTMLGPNCPGDAVDKFLKREVLGADADVVRLDATGHEPPQCRRHLLRLSRRALGLAKVGRLG